jgi:hypothetical protein
MATSAKTSLKLGSVEAVLASSRRVFLAVSVDFDATDDARRFGIFHSDVPLAKAPSGEMQEAHRIALHMTANKRERWGKTQEVISGILSSQKINREIFGAAPGVGTTRHVLRQVTARIKK